MRQYRQLANAQRENALNAGNDRSAPREAIITSYDPATHAVKVALQPADPDNPTESNWMKLGTIGVGNGFGLAIGPNIGDMVLVVFSDGDAATGSIVGRFFNAEDQAIPVPSGEIWAVHKSGSSLKFLGNGDVQMNVVGNYVETVTGTTSRTAAAHQVMGPVMMDKTLTVGQDIIDNTTTGNTDTMKGMRTIFNEHTHPVPSIQHGTDTATTQPPTQQE